MSGTVEDTDWNEVKQVAGAHAASVARQETTAAIGEAVEVTQAAADTAVAAKDQTLDKAATVNVQAVQVAQNKDAVETAAALAADNAEQSRLRAVEAEGFASAASEALDGTAAQANAASGAALQAVQAKADAINAAEIASANANAAVVVQTRAQLNALTSIPNTDPPQPLHPKLYGEVLDERARYIRNDSNDGWTYVSESSTAVAQETRRLSSAAITLVEMEPFQLGGRWIQATSITYPDAAVLTGYYLDTGESIYSQPDLSPQVEDLQSKAATLLQVEAFQVNGRWLQPLEVAIPSGAVTLGRWMDDGSMYPDPTGGVAAGQPNVAVEVISGTQIRIHMRGQKVGSRRYICAIMLNQISSAKNSDVWRTDGIYESERATDGSFTVGQELVKAGSELEFAVRGSNLPDGTGGAWSDLIGGIQHGNEERFFVNFMVDGIAISTATPFRYEGERFEVFQSSYGYQPGATAGVKYVPKGPLVLHRHARWQFFRDADGAKLRLTNRLEFQAPLWLDTAYLAMLGVQRRHNADPAGVIITDSGAREPYWQIEDMSSAGFTAISTKAANAKVWGPNGWAFEVRLIGQNRQYTNEAGAFVSEGWVMPNRQFRVEGRDQYNKLYFNFAGNPDTSVRLGQTVSTGDIWIADSEYTFTTRN